MSRIDQTTRVLGDDLLLGTKAIAAYSGLTQRQVFHLHKIRELPTFKVGSLIAARKSEPSGRLSAAYPGPVEPMKDHPQSDLDRELVAWEEARGQV